MFSSTYRKIVTNLHSMRWRLPLTYAGIALLTAIALSGVLLFTLRSYYNQRERDYLETYAPRLAGQAEQMIRDGLTGDEIEAATRLLSFVAQARVQVLDTDMQVIADSGPVENQRIINMDFVRQQTWEESTPPGTTVVGAAGGGESVAIAGGSDGPYLTFIQAEPGTQSDVPRKEAGYPISVGRGPFGQALSNEADPGQHSNQKVMIAFYNPDGTLKGYLKLSEGPAFGSEIVQDVAEKGVVAGLIAILIAAIAGGIVSGSINQPIMALAGATQQMAQGDLTTRVELNRQDEFGLLAKTFNGMAERVELTIKTLKQFVEDAAHEINTPLTALRTNLELTTAYEMSSAARTDIEKALNELSRLEKLTHSLLTLARLEAPGAVVTRSPLDSTALIRQMVERCASRAEQAEISLKTDIPAEPVIIQADQTQITRVLGNLLDNALKFTPAGGCVTIGLREEENEVHFWVQDTGIGIPEADIPKLFSRFHRARNAAAYPGNGLGLVIAQSIVDEHGGNISVESSDGLTCFTVQLPKGQKSK